MPDLHNQFPDLPTFPDKPLFDEPEVADVRHGGSLVLFGEIARSFGVEVTDEDQQHWRSVLGAAMLLDHLLDVEDLSSSNGAERRDFVGSFVTLMQGNLRDDLDRTTQVRAANYMARQTPERQQGIYGDVLAVDELTRRQRQTAKAGELVDIRLTEADILSSLLALNHETDTPDASARESFNKWVQSWSRVGYTLDSLIDLKRDYENRESQVRPTVLARAVIARTVVVEGGVALKRTPARAMASCAVNGFRYVIKQDRPEVRAMSGGAVS